MKILNFGSCNSDYVYAVHHIVKPCETEHSPSLRIFPGGKGLNQSVAMARAGVPVFHAGCIGADGGLLRDTLVASGADVTFLRTVEERTGHALIQVDEDGENAILVYPGANAGVTDDFIDEVLGHFAAGDLLVLQNEIAGTERLIAAAGKRGMCVALNPSPCDENIARTDLSTVSCLILNEGEAETIFGTADADRITALIQEKYPALRVLLTIGADGCFLLGDKETFYQPAFRVPAVDTTAAGDTFTGYFIAGLAAGLEAQENLRRAACAAALAVSRPGASPSIPTAEEVDAALPVLPLRERQSDRFLREKCDRYLSEHLPDATLTGLAGMLGYAPVYAGRVAKNLWGVSFTARLTRVRCEHAAHLLTTTDLPITDIIRAVGYENESFFRRAFRARYGKNMLTYRKEGKHRHDDRTKTP